MTASEVGEASLAEAEVRVAFEEYERALVAHDLDSLDAAFLDSPQTRRFGVADEQCGAEAVRRWRARDPGVPADRRLEATQFQVLSSTVVVATTRFAAGSGPADGRQSQVWVRTPMGWRIASAHVSVLCPPPP